MFDEILTNMALYKYCIVPKCRNAMHSTPSKRFLSVPKNDSIRQKWCKAMGRENIYSEKSSIHVCEDHFDLEKDMENYVKYTLVGGRICLRKGVVPHKFKCQAKPSQKSQKKAKLPDSTTGIREPLAKKRVSRPRPSTSTRATAHNDCTEDNAQCSSSPAVNEPLYVVSEVDWDVKLSNLKEICESTMTNPILCTEVLQKTLEKEPPQNSQPEESSTTVFNVSIKQEPFGEDEEEITMPVEEITPDISYPSPTPLKIETEFSLFNNGNSENSVCDEFSLLGKEVELKVRQLPSAYARAVVKHKIQTLLFEASIGMYDNPEPQGPSSSICKVQNYGSVASVVLPSDPYPSSSKNESDHIKRLRLS